MSVKLELTTVTCMPRVSMCQEVLNAVAEKVGPEMALSVLVSIWKIKLFSLSLPTFFSSPIKYNCKAWPGESLL